MMYSNRFICSLRVNGKILRENQGTVMLPFGTEYEILLKNINSRRAMVKVSVDGQDITEGTRLILQPNSSLSLERFIKNGNLSSGNKLKFIERSAGIESHRGIKEDDGIVRAEFWSEKEVIDQPIVRHHYYDEWHPGPYYPSPWHPWYGPYSKWLGSGQAEIYCGLSTSGINANNLSGTLGSNLGDFEKCAHTTQASTSAQQVSSSAYSSGQYSQSAQNMMRAMNDAGITVPGAESNQQFHSSFGFPLESNSTVIVLQLRGEVGGVAIENPITVDRKPECVTCGKTNKATNKFCSECGAALNFI